MTPTDEQLCRVNDLIVRMVEATVTVSKWAGDHPSLAWGIMVAVVMTEITAVVLVWRMR